jgi:hypothetical protein
LELELISGGWQFAMSRNMKLGAWKRGKAELSVQEG